MKVIVATPYLHGSIMNRLFADHQTQVLPKSYDKIECDVVVFSGGEDVHPNRYGEPAPERGWFNVERDEQEFNILSDIATGKISTQKVLGICRGHQLMNVAFGGSLIYDIATEHGVAHDYIHPLEWLTETPFNEFLPVTNSMHHQGIRRIGNAYRYTVLAVEPKTKVIEAILWGDKYLGVQFHPESLSNALSKQFCQVIEEWVAGKSLVKGQKKESPKKSPWRIDGWGSATIAANEAADAFATFTSSPVEDLNWSAPEPIRQNWAETPVERDELTIVPEEDEEDNF